MGNVSEESGPPLSEESGPPLEPSALRWFLLNSAMIRVLVVNETESIKMQQPPPHDIPGGCIYLRIPADISYKCGWQHHALLNHHFKGFLTSHTGV